MNSHSCTCVEGYRGDNCEEFIDHCEENKPCVYGLCTPKVNGYSCKCDPGYEGENCEIG